MTIDSHYHTVSGTLSSCTELRILELRLPFDTSSTSRLAHFLATEALDTRSRRGFTLYLTFEAYPGCKAPTLDDWRSLDDVLQSPTYEFLGRVAVKKVSLTVPDQSEIVWGDYYPLSNTSDETFKDELKTLLPRTCERRILWWRTPLTSTQFMQLLPQVEVEAGYIPRCVSAT